MKKLTRLFLLCLMMIAIPVQGIAATAMLCCCAGQHQSKAASESDQNLVSPAEDEQSHAAHSDASPAAEKCSSCADCCSGCGPAMCSSSVPTSTPSLEKMTSVFSSHVGHINDGPERPPRD